MYVCPLGFLCFKFSDVITCSRLYSEFSHSPWLPPCGWNREVKRSDPTELNNVSYHQILQTPLMTHDLNWILQLLFSNLRNISQSCERALSFKVCVCASARTFRPSLSLSSSCAPSCYASALKWIHTLLVLNDAVAATPLIQTHHFTPSDLLFSLLFLPVSEEKLNLDESEWEDIHVITGALKLFFRELPEPLVPYGFFTDIVETVSKWSDCLHDSLLLYTPQHATI